jgi:predicted ABC-type ATPase
VIIAGPNGAGKSTIASNLLTGPLHLRHFVNADVIARGLSEFNSDGEIDRALRKAVREALRRHKLLGRSVIVCQGDKVIKLPPDQIPIG